MKHFTQWYKTEKAFAIILITGVLYLAWFLTDLNKKSEAARLKQQQFIEACLNEGGKVSTVGDILTNKFFICEKEGKKETL